MKAITSFIHHLLTYGLEYCGLYYSEYEGVVLDNKDPENLNRILVCVPTITRNKPLPEWAFPTNLYAGKNYGSQVMPNEGDTVLVKFSNGRLDNPLWYHGWYGTEEKPEEFKDLKVFGFKTPSGIVVLIDDSKAHVQIKTPNGQSLLIKDDGNISLIRGGKKISLGKEDNSDEPAVLGNKNEALLNSILQNQKIIANILKSIGSTDSTVASNLGLTYGATLGTSMTAVITAIDAALQQVETTKSNNVTLD